MTRHSSTDLAAKKTYPMSLDDDLAEQHRAGRTYPISLDNVNIQLARHFVHIVYMFTFHVSMLKLFAVCVYKSTGSLFKALPHLIGIHFL